MTTTTVPRRRVDSPQEDLEPVTIRFPKSLHTRAIEAARAEDRTFASLVIYALRRYVDQVEATSGSDAGVPLPGRARRTADRLAQLIGMMTTQGAPAAEIETLKRQYAEAREEELREQLEADR